MFVLCLCMFYNYNYSIFFFVVEMKKMLVDENWTIGELIKRFPSTAEILLSHKIACIGCNAPVQLSLKDAAKQAGLKEVSELVKKINSHLDENEPKKENTINLTKKASEKMLEIMNKEGKKGYGIKISVLPGGCAGFSYGLDFQKKKHEREKEIKSNGIKLFVEKEHLQFLKGLKIDYVDTLQGAGFKITNPNATSTCSCGQSFN